MKHALVFDSGIGGLSVVRELRALMPDLHLSYTADDAFRPYGSKSEAQLKTRLPALLHTLVLMLHPDVLVVACNTASTAALDEIRARVRIPVIGVVPAIKPAATSSTSKTIAVLGTPGTVARKYVGNLIRTHAKDCQVVLHGSTQLVGQAENKMAGRGVDADILRAELAPMLDGEHGDKIDRIVLACTHFPILLDHLRPLVPPHIKWVDSGHAIAQRTQHVLSQLGTPHTESVMSGPQIAFLIGGKPNKARAKMFASFGFSRTVCL
jgi:glutamate racemase